MKVGIIANCQAMPLAKALLAIKEVTTVVALPIHHYGASQFVKADNEFKELIKDPDAIILSYDISEEYGEYQTSILKNKLKNFYTLTNIFFSGLHPDITYVGDRNGRMTTCLGDYHSKIILHSYLMGYSATDCESRFCATEYEKLGYFDTFEQSANNLRNRDLTIDIAFAENFIALLAETPCLYSTNHPTAIVFQEFSAMIASFLGLQTWRYPAELLSNPLASGCWWPVYNEIAEKHHLKYRTPIIFKQPEHLGGKQIELKSFINLSYQQYSAIGNRLRNGRQAIDIMEQFNKRLSA